MSDSTSTDETACVTIGWGSEHPELPTVELFVDGNKVGDIVDLRKHEFEVASGSHEIRVERNGIQSNDYLLNLVGGDELALEAGLLQEGYLWGYSISDWRFKLVRQKPRYLYLGRVGYLQEVIPVPTERSLMWWLLRRWIVVTTYCLFVMILSDAVFPRRFPLDAFRWGIVITAGLMFTAFYAQIHWKAVRRLKQKLANDLTRRRVKPDATVWPPPPTR